MNNYIKAATVMLTIMVLAGTVAFAYLATWAAMAFLTGGAIIVLALYLTGKHLVRKKADMIISGTVKASTNEINKIVTSLNSTAGNYEPDRYRVQRLRQERRAGD